MIHVFIVSQELTLVKSLTLLSLFNLFGFVTICFKCHVKVTFLTWTMQCRPEGEGMQTLWLIQGRCIKTLKEEAQFIEYAAVLFTTRDWRGNSSLCLISFQSKELHRTSKNQYWLIFPFHLCNTSWLKGLSWIDFANAEMRKVLACFFA